MLQKLNIDILLLSIVEYMKIYGNHIKQEQKFQENYVPLRMTLVLRPIVKIFNYRFNTIINFLTLRRAINNMNILPISLKTLENCTLAGKLYTVGKPFYSKLWSVLRGYH